MKFCRTAFDINVSSYRSQLWKADRIERPSDFEIAADFREAGKPVDALYRWILREKKVTANRCERGKRHVFQRSELVHK